MPYWRLFYHFVWGTHLRQPLIRGEFETSLHGFIAKKARDLGVIVHQVGGVEDHMHMAVSVPPKLALARFVGQVKGASSYFVTHVMEIEFAWQAEYGVVSFGEHELARVVRYVNNQREHHRAGTCVHGLEEVVDLGAATR